MRNDTTAFLGGDVRGGRGTPPSILQDVGAVKRLVELPTGEEKEVEATMYAVWVERPPEAPKTALEPGKGPGQTITGSK